MECKFSQDVKIELLRHEAILSALSIVYGLPFVKTYAEFRSYLALPLQIRLNQAYLDYDIRVALYLRSGHLKQSLYLPLTYKDWLNWVDQNNKWILLKDVTDRIENVYLDVDIVPFRQYSADFVSSTDIFQRNFHTTCNRTKFHSANDKGEALSGPKNSRCIRFIDMVYFPLIMV